MITPAPPPITTPATIVATLNQPCTCATSFPSLYAEVDRVAGHMADGVSQRAASFIVWGKR